MAGISTLSHHGLVRMVSDFRKEMGKRLALARKAKQISQYQLADLLGLKQPIIAEYEIGRTPVPVQRVPELAKTLDVSTDYLLGLSTEERQSKPGPESLLEQKLQQLKKLPRSQQQTVLKMLEGLL
jgi:transcriptional regulator with XRE-family HTH domain